MRRNGSVRTMWQATATLMKHAEAQAGGQGLCTHSERILHAARGKGAAQNEMPAAECPLWNARHSRPNNPQPVLATHYKTRPACRPLPLT